MSVLVNGYTRHLVIGMILYVVCMGLTGGVYAGEKSLAEHKLVIQVSTDDEQTQQMALNNAVNLQKEYGPENIDIEIVAYGPGLSIMTEESKQKERVASLAKQDIRFSACGNTITGLKKKTGQEPKLISGVKVVPAGVARILELQEKGYSYIRP